MKAHLQKLWDSLRTTYWFVPLVMVLAAVVLWQITAWADMHLEHAGKLPLRWLYADDFESFRTLLLTIAGTMMGTIGVIFSIVMVPLTLAASQFGPRLLRNFLRDSDTHITLGTFTATIIFCLLVLLQMRDESMRRLPQISVNTALLLGLSCFVLLIYFIHHVAVSIQEPVLAAEVSKKLHAAIEKEFPEADGAGEKEKAGSNRQLPPPGSPVIIRAKASGYLQLRDDETLMRFATKENAVVQVLKEPGAFLTQSAPIAFVWCEASAAPFDKIINTAFVTGPQRTLVQDVRFGISELVEIAVRALSPAINDPFTAINCLDWLGTALCRLCAKTFQVGNRLDAAGKLRLQSNPVTFAQLTNAAFTQIREYGRTSSAVTLRLMETITTVAHCAVTDEQRQALLNHARLVENAAHIGLPQKADQELVTEQYQKALHLLEQRNG